MITAPNRSHHPADPRDARLMSNPVAHVQRLLEAARREQPDRPDLLLFERHLVSRLRRRGIRFPAGYLVSLGIAAPPKPDRPGIVALVVDRHGKQRSGLVNRIRACSSNQWALRSGLPFDATNLLLLVRDVLSDSPDSLEGIVPESLAYRIEDELSEPIEGPSMTIACLLALLDASDKGANPRLAAAAAVVQLTEDRALAPVDGLEEKLGAFAREVEEGSLLVCHPESEITAHEHRFEEVWRVRDLRELGKELERAGLLQPIRVRSKLNANQLARTETVFQELYKRRYLPARALDLAERVAGCEFGSDVSARNSRRARAMPAGPLRYLGRGKEAVTEAKRHVARIQRAGKGSSYSEQAAAATDLSAAHFAAHDFEEARSVLADWVLMVRNDPLLLDDESLVWLLATLGRAEVALGCESWEEHLEWSLALQNSEKPAGLPRARGYLVDGLLRAHRLEEAARQLDSAESELLGTSYEDNIDRWFLCFRRAELARRRGEVWCDRDLERPQVCRPGQFARPIAYYYQATARQPGRSDEDAASRFRQARLAFESLTAEGDLIAGLRFFASMMALAEAERRVSLDTWRNERKALKRHLAEEAPGTERQWYEEAVAGLEETPSRQPVEALLNRVPYFSGGAPSG